MKKLLIIGAGAHSEVVCEVARSCGYSEFIFVDDSKELLSIGRAQYDTTALSWLIKEYEDAFISVGNNQMRKSMYDQLIENGYNIPSLIHPTAYISSSATIGDGSLIGPMSIVNSNALIGKGCILSCAAVVDHNVVVSDFAHIDAGAVCESYSKVDMYGKILAGTVNKNQ
ncbi:MAG: PglB [Ruminococcus sp.]|nr:PglB [Ruminococcus sp.]